MSWVADLSVTLLLDVRRLLSLSDRIQRQLAVWIPRNVPEASACRVASYSKPSKERPTSLYALTISKKADQTDIEVRWSYSYRFVMVTRAARRETKAFIPAANNVRHVFCANEAYRRLWMRITLIRSGAPCNLPQLAHFIIVRLLRTVYVPTSMHAATW